MVQALNDLLINENFDEALLKQALFSFKCIEADGKKSNVEEFLHNTAIQHEKQKLTRTFLVLDDNELSNGKIKINGYYALTLKSIKLNEDISNTRRKAIAKDVDVTHVAGYLLAQIGRDITTAKGYGEQLLNLAFEDIKLAQRQVGGRLVYLDCKENIINYYEKKGFKILQVNESDATYTQMYTII